MLALSLKEEDELPALSIKQYMLNMAMEVKVRERLL